MRTIYEKDIKNIRFFDETYRLRLERVHHELTLMKECLQYRRLIAGLNYETNIRELRDAIKQVELAKKCFSSRLLTCEEVDDHYKKWGKRLNFFLNHIEKSFNPDLIIIGGGVSKKIEQFKPYIDIETPFKAAELKNNAGIVGAALFARRNY